MEDLVPIVTNISPKETPLLSGLGEGAKATNTLHEYLTDTFAAAADNANAEMSAFTVGDHTGPSRANNITQIFLENIQVSRTQMLINSGEGSPFEYQIKKYLTKHAKDVELALMAGSKASGASATARRLAGVIANISTNKTARNSGDSLSETVFNDIIAMIKGSTDEVADEIYVGTTLKRDISGFTGGATKNVDVTDKRLVSAVNVYEGDFGIHKIFWHRNLSNAANAKELVAIRNEYWKISWLDKTHMEKLPIESIDRRRAQAVSELTLEARGEASSAYYSGFTG
jgi:hypothetical protein